MKPILLFLTCANNEEAKKIELSLLENKLIVCCKKIEINSSYRWKNKIENASEVLLIMDSVEELFDKIELEIKNIHSYETFVLTSVPAQSTIAVSKWFQSELQLDTPHE